MAQKKFIIDGGFKTTDDSIIEANLEMTGHILPTVDSDGTTGFDLGSTTKKWRDLYLSEGSLYIDGQKVIESNSGTIVVQADPNQSLTTQVSGTGVLTLTSATTISMDGTLQMASGKKITDVNGDNVTFGDKIDMDSNKIVNVGTPTDNTDAANKSYVDGLVGNIATDAITEGDSELEIADLGTGTVGITVDGTQRFALSASSLAMTVPITVNGVNVATETYVDTAEADAISTASADATTKADQAEADAKAYTDTRETAITTAYTSAISTSKSASDTYADQAEADAKAYTDAQIGALDFNNVAGGIAVTGGDLTVGANADVELSASSELKSGSSTIVGDDPDNAGNPAVCASSFRPTASVTDLNLRPNSGGAISLDGGDVEYGSVGIIGDDPDNAGQPTVCASTFRPVSGVSDLNLRPGTGGSVTFGGNVLEGVASPVAGTDASNKSYVDSAVANLVNAAPSDLDTLNELAAALGDDANFASSMTTALGNKAATTYVDTQDAATLSAAAADATTKANAAQSGAEATATTKANDAQAAAATDATTKADAAETNANAYTDIRKAAITTAYETYADVAEADAISTASADATTKADAAQAAAEATASADATSKANAAQSAAASDATSKANAAQAAAISAAASDATTKANAAQAAAIAAVTNGAGAAFDTLKEIQDAMATDSELSSAIASVTASATATAAADATAKANAALADAKAYADANDNNTTYSAGNGLSLSGTTFSMSGSYTGSFTASGDVTAYSDESLKTNIQTIDNALDRVEAVRGVTFDRIADGSTSTGVVAQELLAVLPEAVHTDANGVHSVAYGNITGLLIEAVKELSAEVKELKK